MKVIQGDLIELALNGAFDVIVHGCNCFNTMGSGIARQVALKLPEATKADNETIKGDRNKLGTILPVVIERENITFVIVNAYTQYNYGTDKMNADYEAIKSCFKEIKKQFTGARIGYPLLGAGLAMGKWEIISKIIDKELDGEDHTLVEYKP